ncbi:CaiB/BaiF CoA transferase family protein [Sphingomonas baiyangensis]|uniref:CoA transferase n=1 Tax=Sphingomonas baiyangensis TaxID=2572576 RepID=A0A4U1L1G0_9SPHN|nr:CaiB/BaiF CoA-transferase family protein [Sphingomonas baiyangensis]TKD50000.1 CoA transferase [Sphingomonas baiyangensis]
MAGPLAELRVVEFEGIGPGPHCAMLLSDLGAEILRIGRSGGSGPRNAVLGRGRADMTLDLRSPEGRNAALDAVALADVLIEGFRPGVMERLGLGPEPCLARNPRLVYGRMTGWGQDGPLAKAAGHDINYIALTGALAAIGRPGEPATPPLNLVGDFGGGSMFLAVGILAALFERERSGQGQVVDAAIVDGVSHLMALFTGYANSGFLSLARERSMLGGAAPWYRCYICADGREIALGSIEPQFHRALIDAIGAPEELFERRFDVADWPRQTGVLAALFASQPAAHWIALLEGSDACFAGVLTLDEAAAHPHMQARGVYVETDAGLQPAPAPRFSRTPGAIGASEDAAAMLARWQA